VFSSSELKKTLPQKWDLGNYLASEEAKQFVSEETNAQIGYFLHLKKHVGNR